MEVQGDWFAICLKLDEAREKNARGGPRCSSFFGFVFALHAFVVEAVHDPKGRILSR
jgi:hypothetical protein